MTNKPCKKCNQIKSLEEFHKCPTNRDGRRNECKACKHATSKRWNSKNPEKVRGYREKWVEANPEKRKEVALSWARSNPVQVRYYTNKSRARKLGVAFYDQPYEWVLQAIETLLNSPCTVCASTNNIQQDHIIPMSRGGSDLVDNWQPLCESCNLSKGYKLMEEWLGVSKLSPSR